MFHPLNPENENLNSHLLPPGPVISYRSTGEKLIKYQENSSCVFKCLSAETKRSHLEAHMKYFHKTYNLSLNGRSEGRMSKCSLKQFFWSRIFFDSGNNIRTRARTVVSWILTWSSNFFLSFLVFNRVLLLPK